MTIDFELKYLRIMLMVCLAVQIPTILVAENAGAQEISSSQTLKPTDLTEKESDYYNKLTDPEVARNFIMTRSYVRICQGVVDKKIPPEQLPDKPMGFSVRYLLAGEATMINRAISEFIIVNCRNSPNGCFGGKQ